MAATTKVVLTDGTEFEVGTQFVDLCEWEAYAARHDLPLQAQFNATAHMAFTAGKRAGHLPAGMPFDAFVQTVESIADAEPEAPANPTRRGRGPGSRSKSPSAQEST